MPASAVRTTQTTNPSLDRAADRPAISSDIPARLDRLPWSRFHILILIGLGITWILDGIEVTIVGAIAPVLRDRETLGLSTAQIGNAASAYVAGAVIGALVFGWLTDRFGRRTVFYATLIVYLIGVLLTATSWNFLSFALFRAITGIGIGGEYAAINSAIDELIRRAFVAGPTSLSTGVFGLGQPWAPALLCCFSIHGCLRPISGGEWDLRSGDCLVLVSSSCAVTCRKAHGGN